MEGVGKFFIILILFTLISVGLYYFFRHKAVGGFIKDTVIHSQRDTIRTFVEEDHVRRNFERKNKLTARGKSSKEKSDLFKKQIRVD